MSGQVRSGPTNDPLAIPGRGKLVFVPPPKPKSQQHSSSRAAKQASSPRHRTGHPTPTNQAPMVTYPTAQSLDLPGAFLLSLISKSPVFRSFVPFVVNVVIYFERKRESSNFAVFVVSKQS